MEFLEEAIVKENTIKPNTNIPIKNIKFIGVSIPIIFEKIPINLGNSENIKIINIENNQTNVYFI